MVTRRTTSKAKAAAMLKSFEVDYTTACKTKNPQMLEKYFEDLSDDHLKQLCNSANIDARKSETRIAALAAALLERKTTVHKVLRVMHIIVRSAVLIPLIGLLATVAYNVVLFGVVSVADPTHRVSVDSGREVEHINVRIIFILVVLVFIGNFQIVFDGIIRTHVMRKQFSTTKASRSLLSQMRALHKTARRSQSRKSKTKKSS